MKTHPSILHKALVIFALFTLTACLGAKTTPTPAPRITSGGFECPAPEFPTQVTSTELNLLVWTEYLPLDMIECFELVYGVKVSRDEYSSNDEMYANASAPGAAYDLALPSHYMIPLMARQGLLQELDHMRLPVLQNFDPNYLDLEFDPGNRHTIPYQAGTDAIVVNTETVETIPRAWADLWNEEYAGRLIFLDEPRETIGMALLTLGYDVNTTDPAQLEEAKRKLAELVPRIKLFDSDSPKTALSNGDADLGMTWTAEAFLAQQENPAIQYIYPSEGAILWQDNWAMLKNAPHPDAAYAWLNYTMQGNIFWMMLRDFPYTNPNAAALGYAREHQPALYEIYISSPITNTPAGVLRRGHRIADVGDAVSLYESIWAGVKSGPP
jgi:spermidine/putrescine-binding protein